MKKILIVNQNAGYLTTDVANAFCSVYDEVVLMYGRYRANERKLNPKVRIQNTIAYNRVNYISRILTWSLCTMHLSFLLLFKYRKYTVLYYTNPPFSYFNALIFSNPFSVVVFDVYPDILNITGIKKHSVVYRIWSHINTRVFARAERVITLSEGMKKTISAYVQPDKIKVVPIWSASQKFKPIDKKDNPFLRERGWQDRFIVLYSGNMGLGHQLEVLIEVAKELSSIPDILFLLIGDGAKRKILEKQAESHHIHNVIFLPYQTSEVLPYSLASADLAVVALEPQATQASVPSKTMNYLAVGAPILGIGNQGSALEELIHQYQVGFYFFGQYPKAMVELILRVHRDREQLAKISSNCLSVAAHFSYHLANEYVFY